MRTQIYLTPKDHGRLLSLDELEHADSREGFRYELIDGRLEVSRLSDFAHDDICDLVKELLKRYAVQRPDVLARMRGPVRVFVPGRSAVTAPEPDVAAYRDFPTRVPRSRVRWQDISPILVAEVLSEDTADKDLRRNRDLYLAVPSIREYWIIDPREDADLPMMMIYRRRGSRWQRPLCIATGESYTTPLLPGFVLSINAEQA